MYAALPLSVRHQARRAYRAFLYNQHSPGLAFKKVDPELNLYSARVGINYRAVARVEDDVAIWFWIGSHSEYDKLL
jgi:hypothetical protein